MKTVPPRRGRPPVSSREAIEEIAFDLLLKNGYEATTVQAIMAEGGISRTTFFRYFGTKGGIVWGEFDRAVERLRGSLAEGGDAPTMTAIVRAIAESTRLSREAAPDTWLDRFRVLDEDPALSGESAEHWRIWAGVITSFVEEHAGMAAGSVTTAAVGGAMQAAYVAVLREWAAHPSLVDRNTLESRLTALGNALQPLLGQRP